MVSHNVGGEMNAGAFTPMATVKNFGSATQTFNVTMTIPTQVATLQQRLLQVLLQVSHRM